jgi:hypothetical protein
MTYLDDRVGGGLGTDCDDVFLSVHEDSIGLHILAVNLEVLGGIDDHALLYHV